MVRTKIEIITMINAIPDRIRHDNDHGHLDEEKTWPRWGR
jgi:hypothetical protein